MARRDYRARATRWYGSYRWRQLRRRHLEGEPYCQCPKHNGKNVPADVVDHIEPHKGSARLFWNRSNLQSLTTHCHNSWKKSVEQSGHKLCDVEGMPLDPEHPWNRE